MKNTIHMLFMINGAIIRHIKTTSCVSIEILKQSTPSAGFLSLAPQSPPWKDRLALFHKSSCWTGKSSGVEPAWPHIWAHLLPLSPSAAFQGDLSHVPTSPKWHRNMFSLHLGSRPPSRAHTQTHTLEHTIEHTLTRTQLYYKQPSRALRQQQR